MSSYFDESAFRHRVDSCLTKVRLVLDSNRASTLGTADAVPHKYDDKYMLADYLTNTAAVCHLTSLKALGLTSSQIVTLTAWSSSEDISLRLTAKETCEFVRETKRDVDSSGKVVTDSTFFGKVTTKVVTTITEYHYLFKVHWELCAFRGVGEANEDKIVFQSRDAQQKCVLRAKNMPYPEVTTKRLDANVSWLFRNLDEKSQEMGFRVDRSHKDCHTPRRNKDITAAEKFFCDLSAWSVKVDSYFVALLRIQVKHTENCSINTNAMLAEGVFVPVVPLMSGDPATMDAPEAEESMEDMFGGSSNSSSNEGTDNTAVAVAVDNSVVVAASAAASLSPATVTALLNEQERSLLAKCAEMETAYPAPTTGTTIITASEAKIVVICCHMIDVASHFFDGINFIEELIRKQLVSAVGKELQPSDFSAYMQFHNRKLLRAEFQPKPFTHSVRRSVAHSPEGTLRIEDSVAGGSTATVAEPIFTVSHSAAPSANNKMEFTLNAATTVKFGGDRHVHGWLAHSFSGQSLPQLNLVAQARQFSSFIVLVGKITSATVFEPKHAFIVQNKEEVVIPLLLETLPTPKQFRDAIESLSPEQQRFAKAFRSMQLESTLFGVCVIQIKPQLEKVLNLAPDSLTKEIQLTQDLMKLFVEYQIPTDLMSFEGDRGASAATRLEAVRGHVKAMNDMLDRAKEDEIKEKNKEREYARGPPQIRNTFHGFAYDMAPPPPPAAAPCGSAAPPPLAERSRSRGMEVMKMSSSTAAPPRRMFQQQQQQQDQRLDFLVESTASLGDVAKSSSASDAPVHVVVNAPTESQQQQQPPPVGDEWHSVDASEAAAVDYTKIPGALDRNYEKFDTDSALRPTIINVGTAWTKRSQAALLAKAASNTLHADEQTREKTAAFDLLDALSRSGALCIEDASLHVLIAATHSFDQSLMDTVVKGNVNPIERVERSTHIMASTLHGVSAAQLVAENQLSRVATYAPALFIENGDSNAGVTANA